MFGSSHLPDSGWHQCTSDPTPREGRQIHKKKNVIIHNQSIAIHEKEKEGSEKGKTGVLAEVRVNFFFSVLSQL